MKTMHTFELGSAVATILPYKNIYPIIDSSVLICDGVRIIGDIEIQENSSLWYNAILRGDVYPIRIGKRTNIQDGAILHVTTDTYALTIGDDVTIGHGAIVHGATIGNRCLIGMGAIILDGAIIEDDTIIAAGTVIKPGMHIPSGIMCAGVPGKKMRDITDKERHGFIEQAAHYIEVAKDYKQLYGQL
jgi:gamma-carbonic anhydrase